MEAFDFSLGLGVSWAAVFLLDVVFVEQDFKTVAAASCAGESCGKDHAVVGQC